MGIFSKIKSKAKRRGQGKAGKGIPRFSATPAFTPTKADDRGFKVGGKAKIKGYRKGGIGKFRGM